jgi:hypothetical protein
VHSCDDPDVIAGQGTIAIEILRQYRQPIEAVFVPVGGGGLIAGVASYVKRLRHENRPAPGRRRREALRGTAGRLGAHARCDPLGRQCQFRPAPLRRRARRAAGGRLRGDDPERPGSFKAFCRLIGRRNMTEFNYRFDGPAEAHVFVGVEVDDREEIAGLLAGLERYGIPTLDLSQNELAKVHVRHLVGGRARGARGPVPSFPSGLAR